MHEVGPAGGELLDLPAPALGEEDVAKVSKLTKQMMEEAWELSVPLSVDIKAGRNWRDLAEVP